MGGGAAEVFPDPVAPKAIMPVCASEIRKALPGETALQSLSTVSGWYSGNLSGMTAMIPPLAFLGLAGNPLSRISGPAALCFFRIVFPLCVSGQASAKKIPPGRIALAGIAAFFRGVNGGNSPLAGRGCNGESGAAFPLPSV